MQFIKYYIFLVLTVLFWSGNFIFGRLVSNSIEPLQLSFFRWFFVFIILLPYILIHYKNILKVFKKEYLVLLVLATLAISGFNTFLYYGLQTTTATNALLINSSTPIFIIIFSAFIFKTIITKIQFLGGFNIYFWSNLSNSKRSNKSYSRLRIYNWRFVDNRSFCRLGFIFCFIEI